MSAGSQRKPTGEQTVKMLPQGWGRALGSFESQEVRLGDIDHNGKQTRSKSLFSLLSPHGRGKHGRNGKAETEFAEQGQNHRAKEGRVYFTERE